MSHRRRASTARLLTIAGAGMLAVAAACTSFSSVMRDFDRIAGVTTASAHPADLDYPEPAVLDYPENVREWQSVAAAADQQVPEDASENPTGFARLRLTQLVEQAPGDLGAIGTVAHRLLLVIAADPTPLNRIEAYEGMGELLASIGGDPLVLLDAFRAPRNGDDVLAQLRRGVPAARGRRAVVPRSTETSSAESGAAESDRGEEPPRRRTARHAAADRDPDASSDPASSDPASSDPASYRAALERIAVEPFATDAADRQALRTLVDAFEAETEPDLIEPTRRALVGLVGFSFTRAIILALRSPDPRIAEAVAWIVFRRCGVWSLPCLLENLARPVGDGFEYPSAVRLRLTLLRLIGHASGDVVFEASGRGPRPIDFLYETALRDPDNGVRLIAIETMARCLRRDVSFEPGWIEAWWNDFVLNGRR